MSLTWDTKTILGEPEGDFVVALMNASLTGRQFLVSYGFDDDGNEQTLFTTKYYEATRYDLSGARHAREALNMKRLISRVAIMHIEPNGSLKEICG